MFKLEIFRFRKNRSFINRSDIPRLKSEQKLSKTTSRLRKMHSALLPVHEKLYLSEIAEIYLKIMTKFDMMCQEMMKKGQITRSLYTMS